MSSKRVTRSKYGNAISFFFLALMGVFIALPIYYSIINAFKPVSELFLFPPRFVVYHPTFENFKNIIRLQSQSTIAVERYIFNSVTVTVIATAGYILIASLAAYPMAKKEFPGKKIISVVIVFAILFSADVTELPRYMMMSKFGMLDTYWAILLPAMAGSFGVFLMIQFMSGIPNDILEAANIDGSNEIQTFFYIIMPSVKPALFTLTIFTFIATWPLSGSQFTYSESLKMLPTMLAQLNSGGISRTGVAAAGTVVMMLPSIVVFLICQGSVIETMTYSGIKG